MSGSVGGVDAAIPLSAGRIGQTGSGNTLASDPTKFIDVMRGVNDLRLFPGRQELQQQEIQQRGNQLQLFPGQQQQQQLELQRGALTNELAQQQLRDYKNKQVSAGLIPFFMKDNPSLSDATSALGQLKAAGNDVDGITEGIKTSGATGGQALTDAMRTQVVRAFPDSGLPKIEYQQLGNVLQPVNTNPIAGPLGPMGQALPMNLTPEQRLEAQTPQRGPNVDAGQFNYPSTLGPKLLPNGQPNPNANQQQIAGGAPGEAIPIVPSISDLSTPVQYTGPNGKTENTTKGQYAADAGIDPAALGVVKPGQMMPPLPPGRTPGGGSAGGSRGQPPPQPSGRGPFSPMPADERKDMSGPAPGFKAQAEASAVGNSSQALGLQTAAANVPQQKATLGNLQAKLTQFTSGPVADWTNFAKSFTNQVSPFGNIFNPSTIASQDEFRKQAVNLAQQQFQALHGTGTDAQLSSTTRTSPNDYMSNLSNQGIIDFLKGNADAVGVMNSEWQKWLGTHNGDAGTYGKFVTDFNKTFDPRTFQAIYASPQDRQVMLKGMSKDEVAKFRSDYNAAVAKGWIPGG